jgi:diguanylate cyclase (GGDEF)-like protein
MKPASEMHLETAPPTASRGLFASLREKLAERPDTEHQAAIIRLAIAVISGSYLAVAVNMNGLDGAAMFHVMALLLVVIPYSIGILIRILIYPQVSVTRRVLSMFMDIGATTYALYFLGEISTPVYGLYLFNACGNGFRFGTRYLYASSVLSIVGFTFVLTASDYWASHLTLGVGLLIVLFVIPMYFASLVRQLHAASARMRTMATHDTLTGLPNRHSFYEQLQQTLKRAEKNNASFAVIFIDLDGFKPINDALGHAAGDEVLKSVANKLKQCVRQSDVVTRIGGDEFVLILSDIDSPALLSITRKIIDTIASTHEITGKSVTRSSSVGIATYPDSGRTLDELIAYADAAMYRSKRAGKNCFCLHGESQTMCISPTPKVNTRPD